MVNGSAPNLVRLVSWGRGNRWRTFAATEVTAVAIDRGPATSQRFAIASWLSRYRRTFLARLGLDGPGNDNDSPP